jgi:hypothetical protein
MYVIAGRSHLRQQTVETSCKINSASWIARLQSVHGLLLFYSFSNCVAVLALDFNTPVFWAKRFSDFLGACSSLAPMSNFSSVSTRRLCFCFLPIKESRCSNFFHQIVNCLCSGNSFITKLTLKFSPTLSSRSVFHMGGIRKYTLLWSIPH